MSFFIEALVKLLVLKSVPVKSTPSTIAPTKETPRMLAPLKEVLRIIASLKSAPVMLHDSKEAWSILDLRKFVPLRFASRKSDWSNIALVKSAPLKMQSSVALVSKKVASSKLPPERLHSSSRQFSNLAPSAEMARMLSGAGSNKPS